MKKKPWNYMAGTEGTGAYVVVGRTGRGKVGVRDIGGGRFRIRVEPFGARFVPKLAEHLPSSSDWKHWKQPGDGGQNRFSTVTGKGTVDEMMMDALVAIGHGVLVSKTVDDLPNWANEVAPA